MQTAITNISAIGSPLRGLIDRWQRFADALSHDDVFDVLGTEDVVSALIDRSLLEREIERLPSDGYTDFPEQLLRSDHAFRAAAPLILEKTDIALFKDDEPATDWWWRVEELVLGEGGERLLNVPEAAALKSVHPHTIRAAIKDGALPARRLARGFLVRRRDLERWQPKRVGRPTRPREAGADALLEAFNDANTAHDFGRAHELASAIARDPSTPRRQLAIALDAYNSQEYAEAESWSSKALESELPARSRQVALLVLGRSLLNRDQARKAIRCLRQAVDGGWIDALVRASLADGYLAIGQAAKAVQEAAAAAEMAPDVPEMKYLQARMEWHADRPWPALRHVIQYRVARPEDIDGMLLHGSLLGFLADRTGESSLYAEALEIAELANASPTIDTLRLRGQTLCRLGKWRRALEDAKQIIALAVEDRDIAGHAVHHIVSDALAAARQKGPTQLWAATRMAAGLVGDSDDIRRHRAIALAGKGNIEGTLKALRATLETIDAADPDERAIAAIAFAVAEQPRRALELVADIADQAGADPSALLLAAQAAVATEQFGRAKHYLSILGEQPGIVGEIAATALELVDASDKSGRLNTTFAALAAQYAAATVPDAGTLNLATGSPTETGWEGRHPMSTSALDRVASAMLH